MTNRLTIVALLSLISLFDPALGQINKNKAVPEDAVEHFDKPDSTVVVYPNGDIYQAGKFKRFWFGNNYRGEWVTPIEIPLFDFRNENGEMKIISKEEIFKQPLCGSKMRRERNGCFAPSTRMHQTGSQRISGPGWQKI